MTDYFIYTNQLVDIFSVYNSIEFTNSRYALEVWQDTDVGQWLKLIDRKPTLETRLSPGHHHVLYYVYAMLSPQEKTMFLLKFGVKS